MAFRRSRSRAPFRRFRRSRLKPPNAPQHWQAANFFFESQDIITNAVFLTESLELVKIQEHIGSPTTSQSRSLEAMSRRIELGGIVFQYGHMLDGPAAESDAPANKEVWQMRLVTDRLNNAGNPTALPDYLVSQAPITVAPSGLAQDDEFPLRTHWRDGNIMSNFAGLVSTPHTNANLLTPHPTRTVNLRLRRFLDDYTGLFFHFYDFYSAGGTESITIYKWCFGTLYYRWIFSR